MDAAEIWQLPGNERVSAVLGAVPLGAECRLYPDGNKLQVKVPKVCPGKLLAQIAIFTGVANSDVPSVSATDGAKVMIVDLAYAVACSPQGCSGILGGRPTNLKMLQNLLQTIVSKDNPQRVQVVVSDLLA